MSSSPIAAVAQAPAEPGEDPHPVAPEEEEQHDRRREVGRDEEGDEVIVVLVDVPAEQLREDHAVPEARDREELGHALQQTEHDRLQIGDRRGGDHAAAERVVVAAGLEPGEDSSATPTRNDANPCLT